MNLHLNPSFFNVMATHAAEAKGISINNIKRDYYIVKMLSNLAASPFANDCVFKGGTSLSKGYPGSIDRFSEDVDLNYLGANLSNGNCSRNIKEIESILSDIEGTTFKKDIHKRYPRHKSSTLLIEGIEPIKLDIGSFSNSIPYSPRPIKSYIQVFMEERGLKEEIERYGLKEVAINVTSIKRTFVDKLLAIKRYAYIGKLATNSRHLNDVTLMMNHPDVKNLLADPDELKQLISLSKESDAYYVKRHPEWGEQGYDPTGPYAYSNWKTKLNPEVKKGYESIMHSMSFFDKFPSFNEVLEAMEQIGSKLDSLGL